MQAYSHDLRTKILQAVDGGLSQSETARVFGVGRATITRYLHLRHRTGAVTPQPHPGRGRLIGLAAHPALQEQWAAHPDAPLADQCRLWAERTGQALSTATMSRMYTRLGWTRKKSLCAPPSGTRPPARPSVP
jgi:transposase